MAEVMLDLGNGLQIWKAKLDELREQDINAQAMPRAMFDRMTKTIGDDKRLETLPFCATTGNGIEIVSGHHRVRGARAAGLEDCFILIDTTGLDRDAIAAKQLAHNSIHGESEPQLLKKIYESISDVNRRMESFIDPEKINIKVETVHVNNLDLNIAYRTALLVFLPYQQGRFDKAAIDVLPHLTGELSAVYLAEIGTVQKFKAILKRVGKEYDVKATGTVLAKMADIVEATLGEPSPDVDYIPLRDIFGTATIPKELAERLTAYIGRLIKEGTVTQAQRWRALAALLDK